MTVEHWMCYLLWTVFLLYFIYLLVYFMFLMHACILIFTSNFIYRTLLYMHCNWRAIVMFEIKAFYLFIEFYCYYRSTEAAVLYIRDHLMNVFSLKNYPPHHYNHSFFVLVCDSRLDCKKWFEYYLSLQCLRVKCYDHSSCSIRDLRFFPVSYWMPENFNCSKKLSNQ